MTVDLPIEQQRPRYGAATLWGVRLVVLVIALSAAWLSLRHMLQALLADTYPTLAVEISPPYAPAEATIALNRAVRRGGIADGPARAFMADALSRDPLLATPLVVAGLDASARDRPDDARRLFEEVRRRDPRSVIARYWLFDYYLRAGHYVAGIAEAAPLVRLQPGATAAVAAVLTALIDVPQARTPLAAALRTDPAWRRAFYAQVAATPRLAAEASALLSAAPDGSGGGSAAGQQAVIQSLIKRGDFAAAHAFWLDHLPPAYRPRATGVYDPSFAGWPGTAPFTWRLIGDRSGIVRPAATPPSGLEIRSHSDRAKLVAEQMVMAAPGRYRLRFSAKTLGEAPAAAAALRVTVRCATGGKPLAGAVIDRLPATLAAQRPLDLVVPASCAAVLIQFAVAPGLTPGPLDAFLTDVRLTAA